MLGAVAALVVSAGNPVPYDNDIAKEVMGLNAALLCPIDRLRPWNCSRCSSALTPAGGVGVWVEATDINGLPLLVAAVVSPSLKKVVLGVRGTLGTSVADWLDDAEAWQQPWQGGPGGNWTGVKVHHGFAKAAAELGSAAVRVLTAAQAAPAAAGYGLMLTGHSLGGSVITLLAAEWMAKMGEVVDVDGAELYTFGEPRSGNPAFAAEFVRLSAAANFTVHRVVNQHDIVPHLPPKTGEYGWNYHHIPREVWLENTDGSNRRLCDGSGEDSSCSDSVHGFKLSPTDHTSYFGLNANVCKG